MSGALGQQMMLSRLLMVIAQSRHHPLGPWQRQCRLSGRAGGGQGRVEGLPKHAGRGSNGRQKHRRQVTAPHTENHQIENLDKSVKSHGFVGVHRRKGRSWFFGTAQSPLPPNGSPEPGDVRRHKGQRIFGT
ncbi:hypothetical protein E4U59_007615 [Claviceps monticola]|nr:hypothetical protein E4U59_007615 [Claviceps monticola]